VRSYSPANSPVPNVTFEAPLIEMSQSEYTSRVSNEVAQAKAEALLHFEAADSLSS